jgi:predicted nuclease of predicted toxin-antitoxin system
VSPAELKFLTDENVSPRVLAFLRERGHNVLDVKEEGWIGQDDTSLLRKAYRGKRFIISHDRDFGKLAINQGVPCYGIIYLRLKDQRASNAITVLGQFLDRETKIQPGTLVVLREGQARVRQIPPRRKK